MFSRGMRLGAVSILFALVVPAVSLAFSVEDMVEAARAGHGTVVETHSSANTGGQTAASGQSMTTGDVSASSHSETRINANGSGGTVEVKVEKSENGVNTKEEYTKKVEPNEAVYVNVNVESSSTEDSSETKVKVNGETQTPESETHADAGFEITTFFTASVPNFFKKVVGFFSWF